MRAIIQKVIYSAVHQVHNEHKEFIAEIQQGLTVLLGVAETDTDQDAQYLADKIVNLRIFEDKNDKLNLSIKDIQGEILLISQFTLFGDARKGNRPSFSQAAPAEQAEQLYEKVKNLLQSKDIIVKTGRFKTHMHVHIDNDGPVTILLDSNKLF